MSDHIFIHSTLDDAGLSAKEFRVLAHLVRRAGRDGKCHPGVRSIASVCQLNKNTILPVLKSLEKKRFISSSKRAGAVTEYAITISVAIGATVPTARTVEGETVPISEGNCPNSDTELSQQLGRKVIQRRKEGSVPLPLLPLRLSTEETLQALPTNAMDTETTFSESEISEARCIMGVKPIDLYNDDGSCGPGYHGYWQDHARLKPVILYLRNQDKQAEIARKAAEAEQQAREKAIRDAELKILHDQYMAEQKEREQLERIQRGKQRAKDLVNSLRWQAGVEIARRVDIQNPNFDREAFIDAFKTVRLLGIDAGMNIVLHGKPGTGKTRAMLEIARAAITAQWDCYLSAEWITAEGFSSLVGGLAGDNADECRQHLERLGRVALLCFDDLGRGSFTDSRLEHLSAILNERYSNDRTTIVTTMYTTPQLAQRLRPRSQDKERDREADDMVAEAILRRILGTADHPIAETYVFNQNANKTKPKRRVRPRRLPDATEPRRRNANNGFKGTMLKL